MFGKFKFQLMERLRGTNGLDFADQFEWTQWWPRERLLEWQDERLRDLVRNAAENVPFYRDFFRAEGLKPGDIKGREDLEKLPIIDKGMISANPARFTADNAGSFQPRKTRTGGTTGTPFIYLLDRDAWSVGWACNWRGWRWAGYEVGDRLALLAGSSLVQTGRQNLVKKIRYLVYYNFLQNTLPFSSFDVSDEKLAGYVESYLKFGARFFRCYGQAGYVLADFCRREGIDALRFKAVFPTAEQIHPHQRKVLEEQFKAEVYDDYGCYDGNLKAMECSEHSGYHMCLETAIFEFVKDGAAVKPGEEGEILATSLYNYSMPFIRYRVGDLGVPVEEECSCGRGLPLIKKLVGRASDYVTTPAGKRIHPHFFLYLFWDQEWLAHYQVRQNKPEEVEIYLVKRREPTADERKRLRIHLERELGDGGFRINYVDEIDLPSSGKRISIISRIDNKNDTGGH